jgi:hypothetical protein
VTEQAIETMAMILKQKLRGIIEEGFEGWEGTITSFGHKIKVNIDKVKDDED